VEENILLLDAEVVIHQVQQLLLHQVDLGKGEVDRISLPVLVLGRCVVEVLCCADQGSEEEAMAGTWHAWVGGWGWGGSVNPPALDTRYQHLPPEHSPVATLGNFSFNLSR
jgi:hypothetical protein